MRERIRIRMNDYVGNRDHNKMYNRGESDQHPMSAITGLSKELDGIKVDNKAFREYFSEAYEEIRIRIAAFQTDSAEAIAGIRVLIDDAVDRINAAYTSVIDDVNTLNDELAEGLRTQYESVVERVEKVALDAEANASTALSDAAAFALDAEAWAVGTRNDDPVEYGTAQYQNNAAYYSEVCREYFDAVSDMYNELMNK